MRAAPAALAVAVVIVALAILAGTLGPGLSRGESEATALVTPPTASPAQTPTEAPFWPVGTVVPVSGVSATPAGGPGMVVGVVGDSIMVSAVPGLQAEAAKRGWTLVSGAHRACPIGYEPLFFPNGSLPPGKCESVESLHDQLVATLPDLVIWLDINSRLARKDPAGLLLAPGSQGWKDDLFAEWTMVLDRFQAVGARVVVILPPLRSQQTPGCKGVASEGRCREVQSQDAAIRAATVDWFDWLGGRAGAYLVEVDSLLCPNGYPCPSRISGIRVRVTGYDQTHFTAAGAAWFAPRLFDRALAAINGTPGAAASGG
jgi:hypothetical protein